MEKCKYCKREMMKIKTILNGRRQNRFRPINQINTSNFYKAYCLPESRSQHRQDMFVLKEFKFKGDGYFIEIGAADGFDSSNTYLLEKKFNWKGILAEPAKIWHKDLKENRQYFTKNATAIETNCIWKTSGDELVFNEVPGHTGKSEYSTLDIYANVGRKGSKLRNTFGKKYKVKTISLIDLLLKYNAPKQIDYLSIDTEGSEFEILNAFDFNSYDIKIITCEHNSMPDRKKIYNLLINNGYKRKFSDPIEDWYVR